MSIRFARHWEMLQAPVLIQALHAIVRKTSNKLSVHSRGFTLVELLVTVSIIAILSAIGAAVYANVIKEGRDSKRQSDLRSIQSALEQYFSDKFYYPSTADFPLQTSSGGFAFGSYMKSVPQDPLYPDRRYCYKPLKSSQSCATATPDCSSSTGGLLANRCVSYCLYVYLENKSDGAYSCGLNSYPNYNKYNLLGTPP